MSQPYHDEDEDKFIYVPPPSGQSPARSILSPRGTNFIPEKPESRIAYRHPDTVIELSPAIRGLVNRCRALEDQKTLKAKYSDFQQRILDAFEQRQRDLQRGDSLLEVSAMFEASAYSLRNKRPSSSQHEHKDQKQVTGERVVRLTLEENGETSSLSLIFLHYAQARWGDEHQMRTTMGQDLFDLKAPADTDKLGARMSEQAFGFFLKDFQLYGPNKINYTIYRKVFHSNCEEIDVLEQKEDHEDNGENTINTKNGGQTKKTVVLNLLNYHGFLRCIAMLSHFLYSKPQPNGETYPTDTDKLYAFLKLLQLKKRQQLLKKLHNLEKISNYRQRVHLQDIEHFQIPGGSKPNDLKYQRRIRRLAQRDTNLIKPSGKVMKALMNYNKYALRQVDEWISYLGPFIDLGTIQAAQAHRHSCHKYKMVIKNCSGTMLEIHVDSIDVPFMSVESSSKSIAPGLAETVFIKLADCSQLQGEYVGSLSITARSFDHFETMSVPVYGHFKVGPRPIAPIRPTSCPHGIKEQVKIFVMYPVTASESFKAAAAQLETNDLDKNQTENVFLRRYAGGVATQGMRRNQSLTNRSSTLDPLTGYDVNIHGPREAFPRHDPYFASKYSLFNQTRNVLQNSPSSSLLHQKQQNSIQRRNKSGAVTINNLHRGFVDHDESQILTDRSTNSNQSSSYPNSELSSSRPGSRPQTAASNASSGRSYHGSRPQSAISKASTISGSSVHPFKRKIGLPPAKVVGRFY